LFYQFYERLEEQKYLKRVLEKCKELNEKCNLKRLFIQRMK